MSKKFSLNIITLSLLGIAQFSYADLVLDEIQVKSSEVSNDKKPFIEAKAKSTRENVFKETQTIDQVIRSIPGAFTHHD